LISEDKYTVKQTWWTSYFTVIAVDTGRTPTASGHVVTRATIATLADTAAFGTEETLGSNQILANVLRHAKLEVN
jgi:hypothetical protein